MLPSDRWSAVINGTGLAVYSVGTIWGTWLAASSGFQVTFLLAMLHLISTIFFWAIQTAYHILKREDHPREKFRRLDHATMFFLIAGTYTPCIARYCNPLLSLVVILVLWTCVTISTPLMVFWKQTPTNFSSIISFLMAILIIIALSVSLAAFPPANVVLFLIGTCLFILGGSVFALRKPNIRPGIFTFHELFHSFVLAAMIVLYFLVLSALSV